MKVYSVSANEYGNGMISITDDAAAVTITLTPEENNELMLVGLRIFERRQQTIAKSIADMKVEALPAPGVQDGEFTEVDDDISF